MSQAQCASSLCADQFALFDAIVSRSAIAADRWLIERPRAAALVNAAHPERGCTPATLAAELDQPLILALLAKNGADLALSDATGRDPLSAAAAANAVESIHYLLTREEINPAAIAEGAANTALEIAARAGHAAAIKALVARAPRNAQGKIDGRALTLACVAGKAGAVRALVGVSDLSYRNDLGWDALDFCMFLQRAECADQIATRMGAPRARQALDRFGPGRMLATQRFFEAQARMETATHGRFGDALA